MKGQIAAAASQAVTPTLITLTTNLAFFLRDEEEDSLTANRYSNNGIRTITHGDTAANRPLLYDTIIV
jgi:hypothetical protein